MAWQGGGEAHRAAPQLTEASARAAVEALLEALSSGSLLLALLVFVLISEMSSPSFIFFMRGMEASEEGVSPRPALWGTEVRGHFDFL